MNFVRKSDGFSGSGMWKTESSPSVIRWCRHVERMRKKRDAVAACTFAATRWLERLSVTNHVGLEGGAPSGI